ncbi:MAG TPA: LTA synthase family protein [Paenibacillaceae bacterium]
MRLHTVASADAAPPRSAVWRIRRWPVWGALLVAAVLLLKLRWLDGQFDVGGMNRWKWLVSAGAALLAVCWIPPLPRRARAAALAGVDVFLSLLMLADLVYFRYFRDFITVPVLLQAGQAADVEDSILSLMRPGDLVLLADLPIALALAVRAFRSGGPRLTSQPLPRLRERLLRGGLAGLMAVSGWLLIAVPVQQQNEGWARGLFGGEWWNVPIYNVTGLLGFHGYDVYRFVREHGPGGGLSQAELTEVRGWFAEREAQRRAAETDSLFGAYRGANVFVVQAEAFQTFVLGLSVGGREVTPNLNRLIETSLYFPNFYHQTAAGRTSDADFAANCSLHPASSGAVFVRYAGRSFDCLPALLGAEGYDVTAHHAYEASFWNRYNMYRGMGYAEFFSLRDFEMDEPLGWSLGDKSFFRQTVERLKERNNQPFYAMTITLSSHHPYKMPVGLQKLDVGSLEGTILGDYLQAVHYVDEAVGELVELLKREGLWDNTIFVFYGDHDNSITDWSLYERLFNRPLDELEQEMLLKKVPLIIHLPGDAHAGVVDKAGGQTDIAPTLLHLLGIPSGGLHWAGVSLLTDEAKPVVFRNGAFTDGKVYYIPSPDGEPENGACYLLPEGAGTGTSACRMGAEEALRELMASDRFMRHDLKPLL